MDAAGRELSMPVLFCVEDKKKRIFYENYHAD
jgi:hypothetical protein